MKRHIVGVFCIALALSVFIQLSAYAQKSIPPKPNIVYILADDLGYGEIGAYIYIRVFIC